MKKLEDMEIEITPENDPRDYVGYDLMGYPFNKRYPPNKHLHGDSYEGYACKALGVLLYDFCIMGYDVEFTYRGENYYLLNDGYGVVSDSRFTERKKVFDSPMELVEKFKIDGRPLIDLAPELDDIEPV